MTIILKIDKRLYYILSYLIISNIINHSTLLLYFFIWIIDLTENITN